MSRAASSELAERDVDEDFQGEGGNLRGQDEARSYGMKNRGEQRTLFPSL